jgi:hypothetical protein
MKFINAFSFCVVLASSLAVVTALPIEPAAIVARQPYLQVARSFDELDARDPFKIPGFLKDIARPLVAKIPHVGGFLSGLFRRDLDDELLTALLTTRSPNDAEDAIVNALFGDLDRRDAYELDAREPFVIPPQLIDLAIKNAPSIIKAVAPLASKAVKGIKKFFKKLFRRGDLSNEVVARAVADFVADTFARRDIDDDADTDWDNFLVSVRSELAARGFEL